MKLRQVSVHATTEAPPERVFALLLDGSTWPRWAPVESVSVEHPTPDGTEGVGTVRELRRGRVTGRDEIVEVVADRRLAYVSRSGLPVRDYTAAVDLDRLPGGGTAIHWHATFFPARPGTGWILERGIGRFLGRCASGLAAYAGRDGGGRS